MRTGWSVGAFKFAYKCELLKRRTRLTAKFLRTSHADPAHSAEIFREGPVPIALIEWQFFLRCLPSPSPIDVKPSFHFLAECCSRSPEIASRKSVLQHFSSKTAAKIANSVHLTDIGMNAPEMGGRFMFFGLSDRAEDVERFQRYLAQCGT